MLFIWEQFAFGVAMLLIQDSLMGFGLLVIGVCPGGIASNFWTLLLDGDVNLSITMTFVSSIAAMGKQKLHRRSSKVVYCHARN